MLRDSAFDRFSLPRVDRYLDSLPRALRSYPECQASRTLLDRFPEDTAFDGVPDILAMVSRERSRAEAWMPEVEYVALLLTIADRAFDGDDEAFLRWATMLTAQHLEQLPIMSLHGNDVSRLVADIPGVWGTCHRGTAMRLISADDCGAEFSLEYPEGLFPGLILEYFARALAIAIVRVDGAQPRVELSTSPSAHTLYRARWSPRRAEAETTGPSVQPYALADEPACRIASSS